MKYLKALKKRYGTWRQVAAEIGCTERQIYTWIRSGYIPAKTEKLLKFMAAGK